MPIHDAENAKVHRVIVHRKKGRFALYHESRVSSVLSCHAVYSEGLRKSESQKSKVLSSPGLRLLFSLSPCPLVPSSLRSSALPTPPAMARKKPPRVRTEAPVVPPYLSRACSVRVHRGRDRSCRRNGAGPARLTADPLVSFSPRLGRVVRPGVLPPCTGRRLSERHSPWVNGAPSCLSLMISHRPWRCKMTIRRLYGLPMNN